MNAAEAALATPAAVVDAAAASPTAWIKSTLWPLDALALVLRPFAA